VGAGFARGRGVRAWAAWARGSRVGVGFARGRGGSRVAAGVRAWARGSRVVRVGAGFARGRGGSRVGAGFARGRGGSRVGAGFARWAWGSQDGRGVRAWARGSRVGAGFAVGEPAAGCRLAGRGGARGKAGQPRCRRRAQHPKTLPSERVDHGGTPPPRPHGGQLAGAAAMLTRPWRRHPLRASHVRGGETGHAWCSLRQASTFGTWRASPRRVRSSRGGRRAEGHGAGAANGGARPVRAKPRQPSNHAPDEYGSTPMRGGTRACFLKLAST
jgi:hypothetical protein